MTNDPMYVGIMTVGQISLRVRKIRKQQSTKLEISRMTTGQITLKQLFSDNWQNNKLNTIWPKCQ